MTFLYKFVEDHWETTQWNDESIERVILFANARLGHAPSVKRLQGDPKLMTQYSMMPTDAKHPADFPTRSWEEHDVEADSFYRSLCDFMEGVIDVDVVLSIISGLKFYKPTLYDFMGCNELLIRTRHQWIDNVEEIQKALSTSEQNCDPGEDREFLRSLVKIPLSNFTTVVSAMSQASHEMVQKEFNLHPQITIPRTILNSKM